MKFIKVTDNKKVFADGIHDDTKALQECIDIIKDGGMVYFPDGTYLISSALIFYSNQTLKFSDNAIVLRSDKSEPLTRYLLASYSEPEWKARMMLLFQVVYLTETQISLKSQHL